MQITHEEAHKLIHLASDEALKAHQESMLDSHLASCPDCRDYAEGIHKMESTLRPLLQRQWTQHATPLPIDILISKPNGELPNSILLAIRIAAVGVMFVIFMFSIWQFTFSDPAATGPVLSSVPPIPVPSTSTKLTSTKTQSQVCAEVIYVVQQNDTLASIATKFVTLQKDIMTANNIKSETVFTGMKLTIPICNFTPTETVSTLTTTFTPIRHTITSTPGG